MKTTIELPDELMQAVKIRAVRENRRLKDVVADLLRRGLIQEPDQAGSARRRVRLPLVQCARPARPEEEMTPERTARVLIEQEARDAYLAAFALAAGYRMVTTDAAFRQFADLDLLLLTRSPLQQQP